jgi:crotonobetainyl-CoA:carnitine CoA-transferase CaiB-like acyl-CoA transferase
MLRKQNEDELDRLISEWTKSFAAEEVTARLQDAGIAAGAVQRGQDLLQDPQFKHRQHYQVLRHPEMGEHSYNAPAYRLSKTPWKMVRPAPCMGEHNMLVLKDMLGYSEDDVADMLAEGAITTDADLFAI